MIKIPRFKRIWFWWELNILFIYLHIIFTDIIIEIYDYILLFMITSCPYWFDLSETRDQVNFIFTKFVIHLQLYILGHYTPLSLPFSLPPSPTYIPPSLLPSSPPFNNIYPGIREPHCVLRPGEAVGVFLVI